MNSNSHRRMTGLFMIVAAALVILGQVGLVVTFDYPRIFDHPIGDILQKYHAGGAALRVSWLAFAMGSLSLAPLAFMLHRLVDHGDTPLLAAGTALGLAAGIFYPLGIMRWVLLAERLSEQFVSPATSSATRESIVQLFQAFDVYCGNSLGETMAPLAHGLWVTLLGISLLKSPIVGRWMAWVQIISGPVILMRPLEYAGCKAVAELSDVGVMIWTLTLVAMGFQLLVSGGAATDQGNAYPTSVAATTRRDG